MVADALSIVEMPVPVRHELTQRRSVLLARTLHSRTLHSPMRSSHEKSEFLRDKCVILLLQALVHYK